MHDCVDCVVIGAGVVGLATARELALRGREVLVLEAEAAIGTGISSRNSEVIHAGIYYAQGSLKARLCVGGRQRLYQYCAEHAVGHAATGKLIVATTDDELPLLEQYLDAARANGLEDLERLTGDDVRAMEPKVRCVGALWSPSTGIIDSHALMLALQGDLEAAGGRVVTRCPVVSGRVTMNGVELVSGGPAPCEFLAATVVNAAGLHAQRTSASIVGVPVAGIPRLYLAKGHYFGLSGKSPFGHLVYPVAVPGGLGVHVTLDLAGQARFGPDVEWLDRIDYDFDAGRTAGFVDAIRRYYPALDENRLRPAYTGIRPKLTGPAQAARDFCVTGPRDHGVPGYVALYGIESPGLTACLALASHVADQLA